MSQQDSKDQPNYAVLSLKVIWWTAALILVVGAGAATALLFAYGGGTDQNANQLEAIKTAGTIVLGTGGGVALLLAARRQRSTEISLKQKDREHRHQQRVAAATEADAAARRITELYTKAVEQLGSDKAPVRLGGLYALDQLANSHPSQRQTVVNVWCAYLRMPYQFPEEPEDGEITDVYLARVQEREVRQTAQRLLTHHIHQSDSRHPADAFWMDMDIDLTGATLIDFSLGECVLRNASFVSAKFSGPAKFTRIKFTGDVDFKWAKFEDEVDFWLATFGGVADFKQATFMAIASFRKVDFTGFVSFRMAEFHNRANFRSAEFFGVTDFDLAFAEGAADFSGADFNDRVDFTRFQFGGEARFVVTSFESADFRQAEFENGAAFTSAKFKVDGNFESAKYTGRINFESAEFARGVPNELMVRFQGDSRTFDSKEHIKALLPDILDRNSNLAKVSHRGGVLAARWSLGRATTIRNWIKGAAQALRELGDSQAH